MSLMDDDDDRSDVIAIETSDLETGVWCSTCLLPSAVRVTILAGVVGHELHPIGVGVICFDCAEVTRERD